MQRERAQALLSLSLHTSLMLFQILSAAKLRGVFRLRSKSDLNGSKWQMTAACAVISRSALLHPGTAETQLFNSCTGHLH